MPRMVHHAAFAFAWTLLSSTLISSTKLRTDGNSLANTTIPKVLWVTGRWKRDNKKELTQAFKNLQPALNFGAESAESEDLAYMRLEGQKRAEQNFLNWAPPGTEVRYIDNAAMEDQVQKIGQELEAEGVHGVSKAFHSVRAGSFRADLWRLLVLWSHGGVYLDVNLIMKKKLTEIIDFEKDTMVLVEDTGFPTCHKHGHAFWNAVMASTAHNKYMLAFIKAVVHNIEKHTYSWCDMTAMTGPTALGNAIGAAFPDFPKDIRIEYAWVNPMVRKIGVNYSANVMEGVLCTKDEDLHYWSSDNHYTKLWNSRGLFCDEKGPPGALC